MKWENPEGSSSVWDGEYPSLAILLVYNAWHMWTEIFNRLPCKHTAKKKECGSSCRVSCCWNISGILSNKRCKGWESKEKNESSYSPHCTLWWTLHKSHLCSAGGDSLLVKRKTKTNISWDRKPLMMKCSSHRKQLSAGRHGRIMTSERGTHSITRGERGGGLAQSHLAAITCKQTNALTRVHTWRTTACHIISNGERKTLKNQSNVDVSVVTRIYHWKKWVVI